ncbi:hypothetical protein FHR32_005707 [Streptosporangium album]|uniref:Uncharacterized protein n=1 Tax=Streptosporangium album TaxID=47479 RepID=A0A7W7S052_9ACTN|nr:hypothetical protein [Streptosporangium album]
MDGRILVVNIPGKPAVWIGVVVAFMAMFLLPGYVT